MKNAYNLIGDPMSKEDFKVFVRNNPILVRKVNNNETSWQKLYEMYNLYGESSDVWNEYLSVEKSIPKVTKTNELAFKELINMVKNIDLEKVRHGIEGVQKTISLVQDLGFGNKNESSTYESRPIYQHLDD